jgi:OOP family OmpA-OmpF porin
MNTRNILIPLFATCAMAAPNLAAAAPPEGEANANVAIEASKEAKPPQKPKLSKRKDVKWIKRWAPERNTLDLGIYGGILMLPDTHELFDPVPTEREQGHKPLRSINPDLGIRLGYYPSRFFGLEAEGGVMPSKLRGPGDDMVLYQGGDPLLYTGRGHIVLQLGLWSVTPFVLAGAGGLGVRSPRGALGNDIDPAVHFGGGLKFFLSRRAQLRIDVRDVVSFAQGDASKLESHNLEALLGFSVTLGRLRDKVKEPRDRDGDGFFDDDGKGRSLDSCPDKAGVAPDGCPTLDSDNDGLLDADDMCDDQPETANDFQDSDGCPESDTDGDGFWDDDGRGMSQDKCPADAGVAPDGCPIADTDRDGLLDPDDTCVSEPETRNGFQDSDGCPDEVPQELSKFTGVIQGITFDTGKAIIRASSRPVLDDAIKVLAAHPDTRIQISGHTDSRGDHDFNVDLSKRRAESVKNYLTEKGIDPNRIETVGYGPDQPIDTNDTKTGRSHNRRIEFKILTAEQPGTGQTGTSQPGTGTSN